MPFRFASILFFLYFRLISSTKITKVQLTDYKEGFEILLVDIFVMPETFLYDKFNALEKK